MKKKTLLIVALVVVAAGLVYSINRARSNSSDDSVKAESTPAKSTAKTSAPTTQPAVNHCASNSDEKLVIVSLADRHMWACDGKKEVYDAAVITGYSGLPEDVTPTGTYQVYAKAVNQTLAGSDSKGSWNDFVHYWEPFLNNKYGTYGFHDATWRAASDFGSIDQSSPNASHGCVEMDLTAMTWLYNWSSVGTTLTIS